MRIAAFTHQGRDRVGVVTGSGSAEVVHPLPDDLADPAQRSGSTGSTGWEPLTVLALEPEHRDRLFRVAVGAGEAIPLADVRLHAPIRPVALRDFVSFERHVEGAKRAVEGEPGVPDCWYEQPTFLFLNPHSVIGSGEAVEVPFGCELLDFELEVAVVIGRDGRDLTPERAADHIAGYLICNDWSARDLQKREMRMGLGPAKGKDFATTLGPYLTTPDQLERHRQGDRLDLRMSVSVNGVEVGSDRLATMAWSFEELVAYASRSAWVRAGDVIAAGTCANGSLVEIWGRTGRREPAPLGPGDVVTMTVDGLGSISNPIVAGRPEAAPIRPARRLHPATSA